MTVQIESLYRGVVLDTNMLLLHSFSLYQKQYLDRVIADVPSGQLENAVKRLQTVFIKSNTLVITPHVLTEFEVMARRRGGRSEMNAHNFKSFMLNYQPYLSKFNEKETPVKDLIEFKGNINSWHLCSTDTSLMFTAQKIGFPLLTLDNDLRKFSNKLNIPSYHLVWDFI